MKLKQKHVVRQMFVQGVCCVGAQCGYCGATWRVMTYRAAWNALHIHCDWNHDAR